MNTGDRVGFMINRKVDGEDNPAITFADVLASRGPINEEMLDLVVWTCRGSEIIRDVVKDPLGSDATWHVLGTISAEAD